MVSILVLTKNEEQDLPGCLDSVKWSDDIHVYDSLSTDRTLEIAQSFNATITSRKFDNWSSHQNWGLQNIKFKYPWVFYIDADERISDSLQLELIGFEDKDIDAAAYEIQRRDFYLNGKWLKHAQISPFYLRLFRPDKMRYERLVNPVSLPQGKVKRLEGYIDHYPFSKGTKFWIERHLKYAEFEAKTRLQDLSDQKKFSVVKAIIAKDFSERRYHQKGIFYSLPLRPFIKWSYMMFGRRAFLDGKAGVTYSTLQAIYEYFIVLKTKELQNTSLSAN